MCLASDMIPERNALMEYVYPKLKKVCREKFQVEFQVSVLILVAKLIQNTTLLLLLETDRNSASVSVSAPN